MQQLTELCSAACDGKIGFGVFQFDRPRTVLPGGDLVQQPLTQHRGMEQAAVEEHRIDTQALAQEIGQMMRHCAVGRIGQAPLLQRPVLAIGSGARVANRKEAIEHQPLDVAALQVCRLYAGDQAGAAARQCHGKPVVGCHIARQRLLLQIAA